jgi:RNA polymerase sigma factor (sigma-70 family)
MPTSPLSAVIQHLRADLGPNEEGMTDGELLARFVRSRDQDALAALVRRHALMVWGVCRRLLNHHDAEDAFQATFLVLVRKATSVPGQTVANWLYGVARQTAIRLRATAAKRGRRETPVENMPEPTVPEVRDADLQVAVDAELSRLPDHYRGVIVLCDLEGMTRKEAARQLGIPEGSVASRLARARALLAKRLNKRGVVFSGSVAAVLSGSASATTPPALVASTIKAASLLAAGQAAGVVSTKVAALTEGVVKAMFLTKLKAVSVVLLVIAALSGAAGAIYRTQGAEQQKAQASEKDVKQEQPAVKTDTIVTEKGDGRQKTSTGKEEKTTMAWGKEVDGLQAGIRLKAIDVLTTENKWEATKPDGKIHQGSVLRFEVIIRNVSKQEVRLKYWRTTHWLWSVDGRDLKFDPLSNVNGARIYDEKTLQPGEYWEVTQLNISTRKPTPTDSFSGLRVLELGKFRVSCPTVLMLEKTAAPATGEVEIEIVPPKGDNPG